MTPRIDVLDHGFARLVETWGRGDVDEAEAGIIAAARQSTQGSFRGREATCEECGWTKGEDHEARHASEEEVDAIEADAVFVNDGDLAAFAPFARTLAEDVLGRVCTHKRAVSGNRCTDCGLPHSR